MDNRGDFCPEAVRDKGAIRIRGSRSLRAEMDAIIRENHRSRTTGGISRLVEDPRFINCASRRINRDTHLYLASLEELRD